MHPRVSVGGFQANRYSRKPFSPHLHLPTQTEGTFELSHPFLGIQRLQKESTQGLQSVTCYLGQQANSNHVTVADKTCHEAGLLQQVTVAPSPTPGLAAVLQRPEVLISHLGLALTAAYCDTFGILLLLDS